MCRVNQLKNAVHMKSNILLLLSTIIELDFSSKCDLPSFSSAFSSLITLDPSSCVATSCSAFCSKVKEYNLTGK